MEVEEEGRRRAMSANDRHGRVGEAGKGEGARRREMQRWQRGMKEEDRMKWRSEGGTMR